MNLKDSLKALDTLNMLLEKKPLDVYKVFCANNNLEAPCENTKECLCERFGENYQEICNEAYSPEDKFAALNEDHTICSTNDLAELCEIRKLAEDFLAHYEAYMALDRPRNVSIGDPEVEGQQCPTEDCKKKFATKDSCRKISRLLKIRDALINVPDDVLLDILMNYNCSRERQPICQNNPAILAKLKNGEDQNFISYIDENFDEYAEPLNIMAEEMNSTCGGAECAQPLSEVEPIPEEAEDFEISYPEEQVDEIDNLSEAKNIREEETPVEDDGELIEDATTFNSAWFNEHWKKVPIGPRRQAERERNLGLILKAVKEENEELFKELRDLVSKWKTEPDKYSYTHLKEDFKNKFAEYDHPTEGEELETLKKSITETYNKVTGKKISTYSELPRSWKDKFDNLLASGKTEKIKNNLSVISKTPEEREKEETEKEKNYTPEEKIKLFIDLGKEMLGFDLSDKNQVSKYASAHDIYLSDFLTAIKETKKALTEGKIKLSEAEKWIYTFSRDPNLMKSASWLKTEKDVANEGLDNMLSTLDFDITPEIQKTGIWKTFFPIIGERYSPKSEEYQMYLKQLIAKAKQEIEHAEDFDEDDKLSPSEIAFIKAFSPTKMYKHHSEDIKKILKEIYKNKNFDNAKYNHDSKRYEKPNYSNVVNVLYDLFNNYNDQQYNEIKTHLEKFAGNKTSMSTEVKNDWDLNRFISESSSEETEEEAEI